MQTNRSRRRIVVSAAAFLLVSMAAVAVGAPANAGGRSNYTCLTSTETNFGSTVNALHCTGTGDLTGLVHLDVLGPGSEIPYDCASGHFTAPYVSPPNITGLNCLAEY